MISVAKIIFVRCRDLEFIVLYDRLDPVQKINHRKNWITSFVFVVFYSTNEQTWNMIFSKDKYRQNYEARQTDVLLLSVILKEQTELVL